MSSALYSSKLIHAYPMQERRYPSRIRRQRESVGFHEDSGVDSAFVSDDSINEGISISKRTSQSILSMLFNKKPISVDTDAQAPINLEEESLFVFSSPSAPKRNEISSSTIWRVGNKDCKTTGALFVYPF